MQRLALPPDRGRTRWRSRRGTCGRLGWSERRRRTLLQDGARFLVVFRLHLQIRTGTQMGEVRLCLVVTCRLQSNGRSDVLASQVHIVSELSRRDASRTTRFNPIHATYSSILSATCNSFFSLGKASMVKESLYVSISATEPSFCSRRDDNGDATIINHREDTRDDCGDALRLRPPLVALGVASVEKKRFPHLQFDCIESTGIASTACHMSIHTSTSRLGDGSDGVDQAMRPSKRLKSWHLFNKNATANAEESNEFCTTTVGTESL